MGVACYSDKKITRMRHEYISLLTGLFPQIYLYLREDLLIWYLHM